MDQTATPTRQRAAVRTGTGQAATVSVIEIDVPQPGPGQLLVKLTWTGVCSTDKALLHDDWTGFGFGLSPVTQGVAGHEGAGVVVALGSDTEEVWKIGDRVGISGIVNVCGDCEFCREGHEVHCASQVLTAITTPGTFQEYIIAYGKYTNRIPDNVKDEEAAPIMCGGITAYAACKKANCRPGQWIVLLGAGGGVGHFAIQYARAMGMRVIAVDGGDEKRDLCLKLGAELFCDYSKVKDIQAEIMKATGLGAQSAIVMTGSREAYAAAPGYLRPMGTLVVVGIPADPTVIAGLPPILFAYKGLTLVGSLVGTFKDMEEALDFTARDLVHPILTRGKLGDVNAFMDKMSKGQLAGRGVLEIAE